MKPTNSRNFRVGLMVVGAGALFLSLLGFILGGALGAERVHYYILFEENVKGMVIGSNANFQGVPMGVVSDIRFQNGETLVELSVDPTKAIIQDVTRARLDRLLVTGQVTVELEGYEPGARTLPPDSYVQPIIDPLNQLKYGLPDAVREIMDLVGDTRQVLRRVEVALSDDNQARFAGILANLEKATGELPDRAGRTLDQFDGLLIDARAAMASFDKSISALGDMTEDEELRATLAAARGAMEGLQRLEGRLDAVLRETESLVGGARGPMLSAMASLRAAFDDLRGLARQLQMAPDSLIYGVRRVPATVPTGGGR